MYENILYSLTYTVIHVVVAGPKLVFFVGVDSSCAALYFVT